MLTATPLQYRVADLALAEAGRHQIRLAEHEMPGLMAIREEFGHRGEVDRLDGLTIRGTTDNQFWWFNVRASNTEPLLRLNVEAETTPLMEQIRDEVLGIIRT